MVRAGQPGEDWTVVRIGQLFGVDNVVLLPYLNTLWDVAGQDPPARVILVQPDRKGDLG